MEAAVATDLAGALSDPTSALTVFAPTNDAFLALLNALEAEGLSDIPVDLVREVLLYHVVQGAALSTVRVAEYSWFSFSSHHRQRHRRVSSP